MCLSKELICNDIHEQVGNSVDFILKTSLIRQTLDNVTCVMLFFEGFEKLFNSKRLSYGLPESKPIEKPKSSVSSSNRESKNSTSKQSVPSSSSTTNEEKDSSRKIKTANGMIKKSLLHKNQALSSSIVSSEMKEKDKTSIKGSTMYSQSNSNNSMSNNNNTNNNNSSSNNNTSNVSSNVQSMGNTFNYKNPSIHKSNNNSNVMNNLINQQNPDSTSRYARELNEYVPNIPSTTKASKSKYLNFFQKPGI